MNNKENIILYEELVKIQEKEMEHFQILGPCHTSLPVNIHVDIEGTYKKNKHPLWIYFQNERYDYPSNDDLLPISVEESPRLLVDSSLLKISQNTLDQIINFVKMSKDILIRLTNGEIEEDDIYSELEEIRLKVREYIKKRLKKLSKNKDIIPYEDYLIIREEEEYWENHTFRKERTGLPVNITIDEWGSYKVYCHPLWLLFQNNYEDKFTNDVFPITIYNDVLPISIENNPRLLTDGKVNISNSDFQKIIEFVKTNKDILIDLANEKIDRDFFWKKIDMKF